jgi:hypothetical protein
MITTSSHINYRCWSITNHVPLYTTHYIYGPNHIYFADEISFISSWSGDHIIWLSCHGIQCQVEGPGITKQKAPYIGHRGLSLECPAPDKSAVILACPNARMTEAGVPSFPQPPLQFLPSCRYCLEPGTLMDIRSTFLSDSCRKSSSGSHFGWIIQAKSSQKFTTPLPKSQKSRLRRIIRWRKTLPQGQYLSKKT